MAPQNAASSKPVTVKTEFEKVNTYDLGKHIIIVDNIFRKQGQNINQILSRLMKADIDDNVDANQTKKDADKRRQA